MRNSRIADGFDRKTLEALRDNPYRMTEDERARMLAMTDDEI